MSKTKSQKRKRQKVDTSGKGAACKNESTSSKRAHVPKTPASGTGIRRVINEGVDVGPRDTGTLVIGGDDWRNPHYRPQSCGYAHQREPLVHTHSDWNAMQPVAQLWFVLRGRVTLRVGQQVARCERGSTISTLLPVRDMRVEASHMPLEYLWVQFVGDTALAVIEQGIRETGVVQSIKPTGPTVRAMRQLIRHADQQAGQQTTTRSSRRRPSLDAFAWSRLAHDVLTNWWREACLSEEQRAKEERRLLGDDRASRRRKSASVRADRLEAPSVSPLLREPPWTVTQLAERLGYSRSHLSSVIRRSWAESPGKVIRRDRLQRGAELLRQGYSVAAAAEACGYASHQTFSRAFRRQYGRLPSSVNTVSNE